MLRRILLTASSAVALTAAANAADMYTAGGGLKDGPVPYYSWTGFYVGAGAGPVWDETGYRDTVGHAASYGTYYSEHAFASGTAGYNFQFGRVVAGIEGDFGAMDLSNSSLNGNGIRYGGSSDWYGDITGRLGIATGRTLLYGKAGAAWLEGKYSAFNTGTGIAYSTSPSLSGWTAGAGIEFLLFPAWSIKAEYLHFEFDSTDLAYSSGGAHEVKFEPDINTVKFGINYHIHPSYESLK